MQTAWVTDDNLGWVDTRVIEVQINGETIGLTWEDFEERVRAGRVPPEALVRWEPLTGDAWVEAGDLETYRSLHNEALWDWQRSLRHGPVPILTALLVGFQVRVWWLAHIPSWNVWLETRFTKWTAFTLEDGEVWRILTMGLLHTDGKWRDQTQSCHHHSSFLDHVLACRMHEAYEAFFFRGDGFIWCACGHKHVCSRTIHMCTCMLEDAAHVHMHASLP